MYVITDFDSNWGSKTIVFSGSNTFYGGAKDGGGLLNLIK